MSVVGVVTVIVLGMATATLAMILSVARQAAERTADTEFELVSTTARELTISHLRPAMDFAEITAFVPSSAGAVVNAADRDSMRNLFARMLATRSTYYSAYIGLVDGTFFQMIATRDDAQVIAAHDAPPTTATILRVISVTGDHRVQRWTFLDANDEVVGSRVDENVEFDPRQRPWFQSAVETGETVLTEPYVFNSLQQAGITASRAMPNGKGVVGVDVTLSSLTEFLSSLRISPNGAIALYTSDLDTVSASPAMAGLIDALSGEGYELADLVSRDAHVVTRDLAASSIRWRVAPNRELVILTAAPLTDFMAGAIEMRLRIIIVSALVLLLTIPFVVLWARHLSRTLKELAADAERVGRFEFDGVLHVRTGIREFRQLADAFGIMKSTIARRTNELHESNAKLEMLVNMGIAMTAELDIRRLSEMILSNAKRLTNADGGSLYLANESREWLDFQIVLNDTLGFEQGGTSDSPITMRPVPLYDKDGNENHRNVVTHTFHTGKTVNIRDAYDVGEYDFSGTREFDAENRYRSASFLTVPLRPRGGGKVLGALQLINAKDPSTGETIEFPATLQALVEALSSAAAVAVQNWKLMEQERRLFDELVHFVAAAIDGKSPYTARHCERVPQIAIMLAEEAQKATSGPLASFSFETRDEWREFEIAAWLHDCGKVTTPEYIIDKATKLETIYNRIHEIRTRFEVLLRDARIEHLQSILHGADHSTADDVLSRKEAQLVGDFAFVAECNVGAELMSDDALHRLEAIGRTPWNRHFDNRLGLSWPELEALQGRNADAASPSRPAPETLLSDRPEHVIPRESWTEERYQRYGLQFSVPDCLYDRGELRNLSVRSGTLTSEDRFKINEHVAQTIVMLSQIAFPRHLAMVTEYAGSHHESPDGSGYPRGLRGEQLSIPSRILAIADIFEALASTDRPYKHDKSLSETIEILHSLAEQNRIDRDLFELFLSSGTYRRYGERYLKPEQLDEVDVEQYIRPKP